MHTATMARDPVARLCSRVRGGRYLLGACNHLLGVTQPRRKARTYYGALMECDARDLIQARIARFGVWEPDICAVIHEVLRPGDTVVDVGANVGFHSLLASWLVGPSGQVIAVEPSPAIAERLKRNLELNGADNVRVVKAAASDRAGELALYDGQAGNLGGTTSIAARGRGLVTVAPARPLDEILDADERRRARLIKIDIEGGEAPVLARLLDTLHLYSDDLHVLVEASPEDQASTWADLFHRFELAGFKAYALHNPYDAWSYLRWKRPATPTEMDAPPTAQTDVLFRRPEPAG